MQNKRNLQQLINCKILNVIKWFIFNEGTNLSFKKYLNEYEP
jgi:hypothetical protein